MDNVRRRRYTIFCKYLATMFRHSLGIVFQRAVWASYFEDVDAIIFLSPISCFDETLREDSRVNRLEDSYQLWRSVCSSPLLASTQIILFLNKCDLLRNKLKRGARIRDSIPSFGDRKNDTVTAMKCACSIFPVMTRVGSYRGRPLLTACFAPQTFKHISRKSLGWSHRNHGHFSFTSHRSL